MRECPNHIRFDLLATACIPGGWKKTSSTVVIGGKNGVCPSERPVTRTAFLYEASGGQGLWILDALCGYMNDTESRKP